MVSWMDPRFPSQELGLGLGLGASNLKVVRGWVVAGVNGTLVHLFFYLYIFILLGRVLFFYIIYYLQFLKVRTYDDNSFRE